MLVPAHRLLWQIGQLNFGIRRPGSAVALAVVPGNEVAGAHSFYTSNAKLKLLFTPALCVS
ncbi:hypothetical protein A8144_01330 [Mycobacterium leprae 3125609]|nr:hypothetical protein A8144_01330 [Mycobacterium leprae 3125609]OAX72126.1 hypothetical protein A3216_01405 [Mycobacterium leprae 7935681]